MKIQSKIKSYSAIMIDDVLRQRDRVFSAFQYNRLFYLLDKNVYTLYKKKLNAFIGDDFYYLISATEKNKEYNKIAKYYRMLIESSFTRSDILVTIGGGILQDISGFIASTLYRGVRWIFLPTTLLAQADSCIGSKTSINFDDSKNLIGTFYPPDAIYIDVAFCQTLTAEYFNSGLGEIIKFHLLSDKIRYNFMRKYLACSNLRQNKYFKQIILSTLKIKKSYFKNDEFDAGKRNLLNYGHCFGHALESASNFNICHGEAVLVGMGFANLLSLKRGIMRKEKYDEFEKIFYPFYPRFNLSKVAPSDIIYYLKRDKKREGQDLTMVLCEDVGIAYKFNDIKDSEIIETYNEFLQIYPNSKRSN